MMRRIDSERVRLVEDAAVEASDAGPLDLDDHFAGPCDGGAPLHDSQIEGLGDAVLKHHDSR